MVFFYDTIFFMVKGDGDTMEPGAHLDGSAIEGPMDKDKPEITLNYPLTIHCVSQEEGTH